MRDGTVWTEQEIAQMCRAPYDYDAFCRAFPGRTRDAFQKKREKLGITRESLPSPTMRWDKKEATVDWRDFLRPLENLQALADTAKESQDFARIEIDTDRDVPIAFISDWHMGSWGTSYRLLAQTTDQLLRLGEMAGLRIAVLGDMLQMSIKLRNVLEISDNILRPAEQLTMLKGWLTELAPLILWSTWDNHSVEREEAATGFSAYADLFRAHTIYHSGIGHTDLVVSENEYKIASSHYFRGRSTINPLASQMNYIRREAPDRDVVVAGDSHHPAIMQYFDAGKIRTVANCGSLQTNSGYAKRYFSLSTDPSMPIIVFGANSFHITPYFSIDHYCLANDLTVE